MTVTAPFIVYSASLDLNQKTPVFQGPSLTLNDGTPAGITFDNEGTRMYISNQNANTIEQFSISNFDITSGGTSEGTTSLSGINPSGLEFSPDGLKLFVILVSSNSVHQYNLANPFEISSLILPNDNTLSVGTLARDIEFGADGNKLYVLRSSTDDITQYDLPTAYDLTGAVSQGSVAV